ncbi:DUF1932 domain-containing protein [Parvibaculaceae bacterium PLY_AMNH_Bact1]|nr:DUF1932 domain-containing protein [Parvibaculaceae bacterium PLY_AMNH_Bact1]
MTKIGVLGMGGMGHRIAAELKAAGHDVLTCLESRAPLSRRRAEDAQVRDVDNLEALVRDAEIILSILPPEHAPGFAADIAFACHIANSFPVFVDCNAVSPETATCIGETLEKSGAIFIDGGIIGMPPQNGLRPSLYVSGSNLDVLAPLDGHGVDIKHAGATIGQASGIKMCYAALTKGQMTLHAAVLMLAHALDLFEPLSAELELSQSDAWQRMQFTTPFIAPDSGRWVGEMHEIAATFRQARLPAGFHEAAAQVFEAAAATPLADATRETADFSTPLSDVVALYTNACQAALPQDR